VIVGRCDTKIFKDSHVLQEPLPLVSSLIAHDETVEHTLMDCGDKYISGEDTSMWDPRSVDTHGLVDTMIHLG